MTQSVERQLAGNTSQVLKTRCLATRQFTATLCETLTPEDCCLQSMVNASPVRWHLAHTSWFFETFLLKRDPEYRVFDEHYEVLFNSYYNSVGEQFPRDQRGLLSRPSLAETYAYRAYVDEAIADRLGNGWADEQPELSNIFELGIQHEQQHQELILTDLKHLFSINPLFPVFRAGERPASPAVRSSFEWLSCDEGVLEIGHSADGFAFDNEGPRHRVFLEPHRIASRPVTNGEYVEFIEQGGYARPEFWLSLGWQSVQSAGWMHPLYWFHVEGEWQEYTLAGLRPLDLAAPVCHVSYFEAEAFARWSDARLPTEAEWEVASCRVECEGNFVDTLISEGAALHPSCQQVADGCAAQMFGDVWEWTSSSYAPYPGYRPVSGALGEYNGKFMCNQYVLRGGSVATSSDHIRRTYRNFFSPESRWQFSGIRLAKQA